MKWIALYFVVYGAALAWLALFEKFSPVEAIFVLVAAGAFIGVARLCRPDARAFATDARPSYVALYFIALTLVVTWFPSDEAMKIATKFVAFVLVPLLLFRMRLPLRFSRRDALTVAVLALVLTGFQLVFGNGPRRIAEAHLHGWPLALGAIASFVWMSLEAGLVEEVPFRALLQTRLERATGSAAGGIVLASLAFALIHAPGIYLRTAGTGESLTHPSLPYAICYTIVILSPIALFLGDLWMRTRNILVLVLVHGAIDTVPHLVEVARFLRLIR